jgi:hypothetical protein
MRKGTNRSEAAPFAREKPRASCKSGLQIYEAATKSKKAPTLVVGKKPNGKSKLK